MWKATGANLARVAQPNHTLKDTNSYATLQTAAAYEIDTAEARRICKWGMLPPVAWHKHHQFRPRHKSLSTASGRVDSPPTGCRATGSMSATPFGSMTPEERGEFLSQPALAAPDGFTSHLTNPESRNDLGLSVTIACTVIAWILFFLRLYAFFVYRKETRVQEGISSFPNPNCGNYSILTMHQ